MAQVDSRIAMGVQPLDVGASIGRGYQLRDLAAQADARKLDTQLKQQSIQKQKTLGDLYRGAIGTDGKIDRNKVTQGMVEQGFGADVPELQKQWSEADLKQAEYLHKNSETIVKQLDYTSKTIGSLLQNPNTTAQDVARAVSGLTQFGLLKPEQGAEIVRSIPGDPVQLRQYLQGKLMESQQAKDMLTAALPNLKEINLGGHTQMVDTNPLTNPGIVGQSLERSATHGERVQAGNLALSRERLHMDRQNQRNKLNEPVGAPIEVTQNGKPVLVQRYGDGSLRPVEGFGPKTKDGFSIETNADGTVRVTQGSPKLTEQQSKDLVYLTRGESAINTLDALDKKLASPKDRALAALPGGNFAVSSEFQQADQAGREFLAAVLRKDTGAAITNQEFDIYGKMYLPQPGDSQAVLEQKAQQRRVALDAIRSGLGTASSAAPPKANAAKNAASQAPVAIKTDADYNNLPSGTRFKAPDGSIRVKP